ncbi:MAG: type IV toxin-antitoxin system AbiEi family antitoxin domain-containing protein [Archangiaceae bacterium]|nr:type IV toxin-antitoxin system AbiEi family antitoxin domain-containing protein [Archangiaceae bacterium]
MAATFDRNDLSPDARLAQLASNQFGVVSRTQALREGMSSASIGRRLDERLWVHARTGVYRFAAVPVSWHQSLMAACLQIPGAVACGRTAGWLFGLDGLGTDPPTPHELAVDRSSHPRSTDVCIRRVRELSGEWTQRFSIPATHLPRTLIDLAGLLPESDAELALGSAMRGRPGIKGWLTRILARYPPTACGGPARLRHLLTLRQSPSDSGLEVKFEQLLRSSGLPVPTYRTPWYDDCGRIGSLDYVWAQHGIVLQTHGWQWHGNRQRWQIDIEQRRRLSVKNWKIIEVTRHDLEQPDGPRCIVALLRAGFANAAPFAATVRPAPAYAPR